MEGRYPLAIRLIRTNCSDPAQEAGFNEWYDRVHTPDVLSSGMISHVVRYRNVNPEGPGPGYLAIHEIVWEDLESVARAVVRTRRRLTEGGGFHPALEIVKAETWKRIGAEFTTSRTGKAPVAGIFVVESQCADPGREGEFNTWYDDAHIPDLLETGLFVAAYRFGAVGSGTIVGPGVPPDAVVAPRGLTEPRAGTYLAIYETAGDPLEAVGEFARTHRPRLKAAGRLVELIEVTWRGIYSPLVSSP
jgi:hypothetical protein